MLRKYYRTLGFFVVLSSFFFTGCGGDKPIVNAKTEKEANEIIVLLSGKGIQGSKAFISNDQGGEWSISVPQQNESSAINIVTAHGYPKDETVDILKAFSSNGIMRTPQDDQVKYQRVLELQLENTIKQFEGVLDADVNISVPQNIINSSSSLSEKTNSKHLKSSVYIKHTGSFDEPGSQNVPKIKKLVSSRIIGLDSDNVYVVLERVRDSSSGSILGSVSLSREALKEQSILGIMVNKNSIRPIQIFIVFFVVVILLLLFVILFFSWKMLPEIKKNWKTLFSLKQVGEEETKESSSAARPEKKKEENKEPKEKDNSEEKTKPASSENNTSVKKEKKNPKSERSYDDIDDGDIGI